MRFICCLLILLPGIAADAIDPLIPPANDDLERLETAVITARNLAQNDYCASIALRPRFKDTTLYLENMQKWLAFARHNATAQLKNIVDTQVRDANRAADLQKIITMQETLLDSANLSMNLISLQGALSSLHSTVDIELAHGDPKLMRSVLTDKITALYNKYNALNGLVDDVGRKISGETTKMSPLLEKSDSLTKYLKSLYLTEYEYLTNISLLLKRLWDLRAVKSEISIADFQNVVSDLGTAIARYRQSELMKELEKLLPDIAAVRESWETNYANYRRLQSRNELIYQIIADMSSTQFDSKPCHQPCSQNSAVSEGMALGGEPFKEGAQQQYAAALRTFTASTTGKYTKSIMDVAAIWLERRKKDPPVLTLDKTASKEQTCPLYDDGELVKYKIHVGPSCHGAELKFDGNPNYFGPYFEDVSGSLLPDHQGFWKAYLIRDHFASLFDHDEKCFQVAMHSMDSCLIGTWMPAPGETFAGYRVTFKSDGTQIVDYTNSEPAKLDKDSITWRGVGSNKISTNKGVATIVESYAGTVTLTLKSVVIPNPVVWKLGTRMGLAGLGDTTGDNRYVCTRSGTQEKGAEGQGDTLTYQGSTHRERLPNFAVKLVRGQK